LRGDFDQNVVLTHVATFREISTEECFHKSVLMIPLFGPPQQPVPGQGIGSHENFVKVKINSETLAGCSQFSIHCYGPFPTAEFPGPVDLPINPLKRHLGIELEWTPNDTGFEF